MHSCPVIRPSFHITALFNHRNDLNQIWRYGTWWYLRTTTAWGPRSIASTLKYPPLLQTWSRICPWILMDPLNACVLLIFAYLVLLCGTSCKIISCSTTLQCLLPPLLITAYPLIPKIFISKIKILDSILNFHSYRKNAIIEVKCAHSVVVNSTDRDN